jgi:hypothetical protein
LISFRFRHGSINIGLLVKIETCLNGDATIAKSFGFALGRQPGRRTATHFPDIDLATQLGIYSQYVGNRSGHDG